MSERLLGLQKWTVHAGGTAAARGKHGYTYRSAEGIMYSISPYSSKQGWHLGCILTCTPSRHGGLHAWIDLHGVEYGYPPSASSYRSPQAAVKAAQAHASAGGCACGGSGPCECPKPTRSSRSRYKKK